MDLLADWHWQCRDWPLAWCRGRRSCEKHVSLKAGECERTHISISYVWYVTDLCSERRLSVPHLLIQATHTRDQTPVRILDLDLPWLQLLEPLKAFAVHGTRRLGAWKEPADRDGWGGSLRYFCGEEHLFCVCLLCAEITLGALSISLFSLYFHLPKSCWGLMQSLGFWLWNIHGPLAVSFMLTFFPIREETLEETEARSQHSRVFISSEPKAHPPWSMSTYLNLNKGKGRGLGKGISLSFLSFYSPVPLDESLKAQRTMRDCSVEGLGEGQLLR